MAQKQCAKSVKSEMIVKTPSREKSPHEPPRDTFQVVILCTSEAEQECLYEEFRARNFQVRLLTM